MVQLSSPSGPGRLLHAETCLYTMIPDEHFVIDTHPEFSQAVLVAGFSGHGYKFASVLREVLVELATVRSPHTIWTCSLCDGSKVLPPFCADK